MNCGRNRLVGMDCFPAAWKADAKGGSLAGPARNLDCAFIVRDQVPDYRQTEAISLLAALL